MTVCLTAATCEMENELIYLQQRMLLEKAQSLQEGMISGRRRGSLVDRIKIHSCAERNTITESSAQSGKCHWESVHF